MTITKLLIANRGEIAVRIARAAAELDISTVSIAPADDHGATHTRVTDETVELAGTGANAYLDIGAVVVAAIDSGADAVHPGYGFLAENADFARACAGAGLTFVGPDVETLVRFGDKQLARAFAAEHEVPLSKGAAVSSAAEAVAFFEAQGGPVMVKAVGGGGGRGMRPAHSVDELTAAFERCGSEAQAAFGDARLYVEQLVDPARHVELQVVGDGTGAVVVLGDRECSLQRRHQKIIEIAPAIGIDEKARSTLVEATVQMASAAKYRGVGTFEFLVGPWGEAVFIEANARIQVEHTVTEMVSGVDLVAAQLRIAGGEGLADIGLVPGRPPSSVGVAIQARVSAERLSAEGEPMPAGGTLTVFTPPSGPGIRVDTAGRVGQPTNPRYDPLLAKVIAHGDNYEHALGRLGRALGEFDLAGVDTNLDLLRALIDADEVRSGQFHTLTAELLMPEIAAALAETSGLSETVDPLDVLSAPASRGAAAPVAEVIGDQIAVVAPMIGTIVSLDVEVGAEISAGAQVAVMEAMKMEHVITAPSSGVVAAVHGSVGDAIDEGALIVAIEPGEVGTTTTDADSAVDLDHIRPDLAESIDRHEVGHDHRRPAAVERRLSQGRRTARANVDDLLDEGSFVEYGPLVLAAQRRRRSVQELIEKTPGDGIVGGVGTVGADRFDDPRVAVMTYDYTVLAGTQGHMNHYKKDRLFELAERWQLPTIVFAEGGGGRPGDTDGTQVAGLDCLAFWIFGRLSGLVPLVGINTGYCFAGNAALLGMCDVVISTRNANLGMGGPAMIEGGGLGVFHPKEVGPIDDQWPNGVIDLLVDDDAEAVEVAKKYLSYFLGSLDGWEAADQRKLRHVIPENRLRIYEVRDVIDLLFDTDSVLELRGGFGPGMVTAFARIEGRPVGVVANDPTHLAGAIDSDGADKASRFMQLCDAFDIPIVMLCDTPGIMVGPEAEKSGTVRHASRMFVTGGSLTVPFCTVVLRKGYGLGAQAMAGGSFKAPMFTISWPTGEFGGMGLEGAVKLGYRNELEAIDDPGERQAAYLKMVDRMYEVGKALNFASVYEIDDVIDPADTRRWIVGAFTAAGPPRPRDGKKRPMIDTW
ncbi:MAG: ATP-grasp domain-containing protein [Actinomycetia bacterium]|nr:ATP-grasp domain-containing protein [Actinomycetes bacterium]